MLIVFGNPIYKIINEQLFDRYYSKISIENKMEKIFDETVQKNCSIRLEKNRDIDEVLVARIECNYSEKDYEKIHDFLQQLSKLNMVNYKLIMVYINDDIVKNISNNSLSIDNNIVWQKGEKQEEIVCHPDSRNTYGTIIEICNLYNRPQGYRIKEYYTGNEIIVEDSSISSIGYSYEFEYEVGDFVEIIGEPFNDYYIPDARIYSFDINDMNN